MQQRLQVRSLLLLLEVERLKCMSSFKQVYVEIMAVLTHLQRNEELPAPSSGRSLLVML